MKIQNLYNDGRIIYLFCREDDGRQVIIKDDTFYPYYYEESVEGKYIGIDGTQLTKINSIIPSDVRKIKSKTAWESDVSYPKRYLIDKIDKIEKSKTKVAVIDIEILMNINEKPDPILAKNKISCITVGNLETEELKTFFLPEYDMNEYGMLEDFCDYMKKEAYDVVLSWYGLDFDVPYLYNRIVDFCKKTSPIGKERYIKETYSFPAGTTYLDYLFFYKKRFPNLSAYTLDYVLELEFGIGKQYKKVDFSKMDETIKLRNQEDVSAIIKIEKTKGIFSLLDEIRVFSKIEWSDLEYNSRIIDSLLLQQAKIQGVVLPNKPISEDYDKGEIEFEFEGAYRVAHKTGLFNNLTDYDLSAAYANTAIDFCLDYTNLNDTDGLKIDITDRETEAVKDTIYVKQNPSAMLPTVIKFLTDEKNKWKKILKDTTPNTEEYKNIESKYNAIKQVQLSSWGVCGLKFFRLYNPKIAGAITSLVREVLHYIERELECLGYPVVYVDTDGAMIQDNGKHITELLNQLIQKWAKEKYNKTSGIEFELKGTFESILIVAMCRYVGRMITNKGVQLITKGVEVKRKDSTVFCKRFQETLINKILDNATKTDIDTYIIDQCNLMKSSSVLDFAIPAKIGKSATEYKVEPIFLRALRYSSLKDNRFKKYFGDLFYYTYIVSDEYEEKTKEEYYYKGKKITDSVYRQFLIEGQELTTSSKKEILYKLKLENSLEVRYLTVKGKNKDVVAFDEDNLHLLQGVKIDYIAMIERNILNKVEVIYNALGWEYNKELFI